MSWSEGCGSAMAFSVAYQLHMTVQYCCEDGVTSKFYLSEFYFYKKTVK